MEKKYLIMKTCQNYLNIYEILEETENGLIRALDYEEPEWVRWFHKDEIECRSLDRNLPPPLYKITNEEGLIGLSNPADIFMQGRTEMEKEAKYELFHEEAMLFFKNNAEGKDNENTKLSLLSVNLLKSTEIFINKKFNLEEFEEYVKEWYSFLRNTLKISESNIFKENL